MAVSARKALTGKEASQLALEQRNPQSDYELPSPPDLFDIAES
jgi:hypothetical protein